MNPLFSRPIPKPKPPLARRLPKLRISAGAILSSSPQKDVDISDVVLAKKVWENRESFLRWCNEMVSHSCTFPDSSKVLDLDFFQYSDVCMLTSSDLSEITPVAPLGHGAFGTVWKANLSRKLVEKCGFSSIAVKQIPIQDLVAANVGHHALRELRSLKIVSGLRGCKRIEDDQFCVRLLGHASTKEYLFFFLELLEERTLKSLLRRGEMSITRSTWAARCIAGSLHSLHARGIAYRDLKLDNVCIRSTGEFVLIDFGFCKSTNVISCACVTDIVSHTDANVDIVPDMSNRSIDQLKCPCIPDGQKAGDPIPLLRCHNVTETLVHLSTKVSNHVERRMSVAGTDSYMAPEVNDSSTPTQVSSDIFSFGVILYELLVGYSPFSGESLIDNNVNMVVASDQVTLESGYVHSPTHSMNSVRISQRIARDEPDYSHSVFSAYPDAKELIQSMLQKDYRLRPSAHEILNSPFLNQSCVNLTCMDMDSIRKGSASSHPSSIPKSFGEDTARWYQFSPEYIRSFSHDVGVHSSESMDNFDLDHVLDTSGYDFDLEFSDIMGSFSSK